MAYVVKDRVKVTSTTTGTGTFTLGSAVDGYQDFSVIGDGNQTYYTITDGTDWEVGIGTYTSSGTTLSRDTILESSNSNAAVNWGAGSKDVFVTFPADNTQGTVPTGDNSSVGTDLVAWTNLKKTLDAGAVNGLPYSNSNMGGVFSTYSIVYTTTLAYIGGGVLSQNGDIHFVPFYAAVGQKVSAANVVSTYSLIYTTGTGNGLYGGGVLAPNGDIHFIPLSANRGQKVSASNVVSTYSLAYTTAIAYTGGVVAPNGDIHFIPRNAAVGQKVNGITGVASTYSLLYTTTTAYISGVLAPNGDIYFVPANAAVGQKISAAGTVSTYSLVHTSTGTAYGGGVLAPNGDIHFAPYAASSLGIGQKVNGITGVVSTYSWPATSSSFIGGVLAPNGDVYFPPQSGTTGVRISTSGVISTFAYPSQSNTQGLNMNFNGEVHSLLDLAASVGQKISFGVQVEPGFALSPFFNKF